MNHAGYLYMPLRAPEALITGTKDAIGILGGVEAVVGIGVSGAMAAPMVARDLGLRCCIVRKEDDVSTHSYTRFEGTMEKGDRWVFLDDLICSGKTFRFVWNMMQNHEETEGKYTFAGMYMYSTLQTHRADSNAVQLYLDGAGAASRDL